MASEVANTPLGVLLIEDVPAQRLAMAQMLRDAAMRVIEVGTVEAATDALDADPDLHVLVVDIELQGEPLSGLTFSKAVAARWPDVVMLIVSGRGTPDADVLPQGARFVAKPFEPETLVGAVRDLVATRAAGRLAPDGSEIG